jgi:hypothetical protein
MKRSIIMRRIELTDEELGALVTYLDVAVKQVGIQAVKNVFVLLNKLESAPVIDEEDASSSSKDTAKKK